MPKPRCSGGSPSMRRSSSQMLPLESGSSPARQLRAVDLPQPDGPRRAMNSPPRIVRLSSLSAACSPKLRPIRSRRSSEKRWSRTAQVPLLTKSNDRRLNVRLLLPDGLVPQVERDYLLIGRQRRHLGELRNPGVELGRDDVLESRLAVCWGHGERHALHGRARIEVALVIRDGLLIGLEHPGDEIQVCGEGVGRDAARDHSILGVCYPGHVLELSLIHISEPTRLGMISYAVFCLK